MLPIFLLQFLMTKQCFLPLTPAPRTGIPPEGVAVPTTRAVTAAPTSLLSQLARMRVLALLFLLCPFRRDPSLRGPLGSLLSGPCSVAFHLDSTAS